MCVPVRKVSCTSLKQVIMVSLRLSVSMVMGRHFTAFILWGRGSCLCHAIGQKLQPKEPTRPRSMRMCGSECGSRWEAQRDISTGCQWHNGMWLSEYFFFFMSNASFYFFNIKNLWHGLLARNVDSSLWISQCKEDVWDLTPTHTHTSIQA